jgi:hypothetical protein
MSRDGVCTRWLLVWAVSISGDGECDAVTVSVFFFILHFSSNNTPVLRIIYKNQSETNIYKMYNQMSQRQFIGVQLAAEPLHITAKFVLKELNCVNFL